MVKVMFFLSSIIKSVQQAKSFEFWTWTFEKISKKTVKFWVFCPFFQTLRPRRGNQHSKFWKVVEQKLFLISVRNFLDYSSSQILRLKISHTKMIQPTLCVRPSFLSSEFHPRKNLVALLFSNLESKISFH